MAVSPENRPLLPKRSGQTAHSGRAPVGSSHANTLTLSSTRSTTHPTAPPPPPPPFPPRLHPKPTTTTHTHTTHHPPHTTHHTTNRPTDRPATTTLLVVGSVTSGVRLPGGCANPVHLLDGGTLKKLTAVFNRDAVRQETNQG